MPDKAPKPAPPRKKRAAKKPAAPEPDLEAAAAAAGAAAVKNGAPAEPPPSDEPPHVPPKPSRKRETKAQRRKLTEQIEEALAEILTMPAIPSQLILGDEWLAQHFTDSGKQLAHQVAVVSERNDTLREWCRRAMEGESIAVLLMASVMYVYPPLLHFGLLPGPAGLLGVPVRRRNMAGEPQAGGPGFEPVEPSDPVSYPVEPEVDEPEPPAVAV